MLDIMIEFTACCRSYGLRVSTSELLDCVRHLALIDPIDEKQFRTVLQSNYAKSRRDQNRFNSLYDLFFHGIKPLNTDNSFTHLSGSFNEIIELVKKNRADIQSENNHVEDELIEFLQGKPSGFLNSIHKLDTMSVRQQKFFKSNMDQLSAKLNIMLIINRMRARLVNLVGTHFDHLDEESRRVINDHFNNMLSSAQSLLSNEPRENNYSLIERRSLMSATEELSQKPFSSLSIIETEQVKDVIEMFARKLKEKASKRFRIKKRGNIDIKKTLRNAGKYQGVPIEIKFRDRPRSRSSLIVLCDISGSVWSSARFMLNVLYSLQDCFDKVRSFVFVAEPYEVTEFFESYDVISAIDKILSCDMIKRNIPTDYGALFSAFRKAHITTLNHRTTVIIIGDGRSNYMNPQAHILAEIREKSRRVIWLNPEPFNTWSSGDSEIYSYKPHCHEIRTCMNLNHLTEFVQELIL